MALLEKLAGAPDASGTHCKIPPVHFWATVGEIAQGEITETQAGNYWDGEMGGAWESSDTTDLAWLMNEYDTAGNAAQKQTWFLGLLPILLAVELKAPGYTTDSDIKARIQRL